MKRMRGLSGIAAAFVLAVLLMLGGASGAKADTAGSNISCEFNEEYGILTVDGQGSIPDYASGDATPWSAYREKAKYISIGESITGIGANAFAGFSRSGLRIVFNQSKQPTVSSTAFSGISDAKCRYFDKSWTLSGNYGGSGITWIYLPVNQIEDPMEGASLLFTEEGSWKLSTSDGTFTVTGEQAVEASYERGMFLEFEAIPTKDTDKAVYSDVDNIGRISLINNCSGKISFALTKNSSLFSAHSFSPSGTLEITDPRTYGVEEMESRGGSIIYKGNVGMLDLREAGSGSKVEITGKVSSLVFFDETSSEAYKGSVSVNGTVQSGYVYGKGSLIIPNVGSVETAIKKFENYAASGNIITDGKLVIDSSHLTSLSPKLDMYILEYFFYDADGQLKAQLNLYPQYEYEADAGTAGTFTGDLNLKPEDIYWADETIVNITSIPANEQIVLNGKKGDDGSTVGLGHLSVNSGSVVLNCPVVVNGIVNRGDEAADPIDLVINSTIAAFEIDAREGTTVTLGENGKVVQGKWKRGARPTRYFDEITGPATLFKNGTLQVLSQKDGENIMSMVPSNDEVSSAAGTAASVELSEASTEDMTEAESQALTEFLSANNGWETAAVFDVSVNKVELDEDGNEIIGEAITSLNSDVSLTVSNEAESSAFIVRLHEENGTVTAAQLSQASDAESLLFKSGLFSTYAIVSASNGTSGKCGDNLTWKIDANGNLTITGTGAMYDYSVVEGATTAPWGDAVTSITIGDKVTSIGDNAFYKCTGLKEVEIPESVTGIGEGAFFGCSALEKATIPASVTSIGEDAFASCPKLTIYCYWDSKALAYAKANKIPYVIIGETPTTAPTVVPKTGDNAFPALWIGLVILGIIGMGAAVLLRRNRK